MLSIRVMPCLLLRNEGLVKTVKFKDPVYVGDPINTVRIFNEKEVDELIFLDITATINNRRPQFAYLAEIASECFMPFAYGGGVSDLSDLKQLFNLGAEKVALNSHAYENPNLLRKAADHFGSQSIIASIDVKRSLTGRYSVYTHGGRRNAQTDPVQRAQEMAAQGAGEILLTAIDRDGTFKGYDTELIHIVSQSVDIPLIACGGAGRVEDFGIAVSEGGASAVAAGSIVVYQGINRAVLVNFPSKAELRRVVD